MVSDTANTTRMTGAEAIVASLEALGVTDVFGMPGGAILPTYDPLLASTSIRHILVRHEQGAGHAAEGYALATGKVGCAIADAQAPVLYVGGGIVRSGSTDALAEFVEVTNAPVVTTLTARGAFPDSDRHNLGMPGMHGTVAAVGALQRADLIVALGARFDDRVTGRLDSFAPRATVVHIDIDAAEISKNRHADIPIVADLATALPILTQEIAQASSENKADISGWWRYLDRLRTKYPIGWAEPDDGMMAPQEVIKKLSDKVGPDAIYVTGVGQHQMWASQFITLDNPRSFISSCGSGTMGYCIPAAMGAQVGAPDKVVWAIDGDGSFQMTNQELATCTINSIPIKVALINNSVLGMVRQWQSLFFGKRYSNTTLNPVEGEQIPNFEMLAQAYGMAARTVRSIDEVDEAIDWAMSINDRPVLIDFRVSKDSMVWPMVAAGVSNDEIRYAKGMAPDWEVED